MNGQPEPKDERIEKLEQKINQNRWSIVLLVIILFCLVPPVLLTTTLTMVDISAQDGKVSVKTHPLSEEFLVKVGTGAFPALITILALFGKYDVIEALTFKKRDDERP